MERYLRTTLIAACLSIHSSFALAQADPPATGVTPGVILIMSVLILITAGAAAWLLMWARRSKRRAQASLTWPQVAGKVIESRLTHRVVSGGEGADTIYYKPHIRYAYEVGGRPYQSDTVRFGNLETSVTNKAQAYLTKYPEGSAVSVRYDPADPQVATLESEAATGSLLVFGILMLIMSAACIGLLGYMLTLG